MNFDRPNPLTQQIEMIRHMREVGFLNAYNCKVRMSVRGQHTTKLSDAQTVAYKDWCKSMGVRPLFELSGCKTSF